VGPVQDELCCRPVDLDVQLEQVPHLRVWGSRLQFLRGYWCGVTRTEPARRTTKPPGVGSRA
jgi:hypothetical protein